MQSLPSNSRSNDYSSRNSRGAATRINPLLVSLTINSVGSGQNSPREETGKHLAEYLSNLPRISQQKDNSSFRRGDALSKSMAMSYGGW